MGRRARVLFDGEPAGWLLETAEGMEFRYDADYRTAAGAQPVSLTLPLSREVHRSKGPLPYFMGLLPEGWLFKIALSKLKLSSDDPFGLLLALCRECTGAVSLEAVDDE